MIFFLGVIAFVLTLHLTEVRINPAAPKSIAIPYLIGLVFLDLAILGMMVTLYLVENGKL